MAGDRFFYNARFAAWTCRDGAGIYAYGKQRQHRSGLANKRAQPTNKTKSPRELTLTYQATFSPVFTEPECSLTLLRYILNDNGRRLTYFCHFLWPKCFLGRTYSKINAHLFFRHNLCVVRI